MRSLQDALYNWLTIKVVCDARPEDSAAKETKDLFEKVLSEDHGVADIEVNKEDPMYFVSYTIKGEQKKQRYPIELIDIMLNQINENPERYENFPIEEEK
ncbi:hypothetical protein [Bacillus sp. EB600]|uniref:hypothetical protein n=1 Tax=Bacillus sp. EB600 TaxID=2806345 RepID=UPI00210DF1BE|nr:hypothetical protein [Bacillus sp. EB600]MCQ6279801.1 hypothetical protein [Bacillus sp. EB600]